MIPQDENEHDRSRMYNIINNYRALEAFGREDRQSLQDVIQKNIIFSMSLHGQIPRSKKIARSTESVSNAAVKRF